MEDNKQLIELLLQSAAEYGKTSLALFRLKTLDKASEVGSSITMNYVVFVILASFVLFMSLGFAFWLGEILGKTCYGFFVVGGFYFFNAFVLYFILHKWIKRLLRNYIINQGLK